MKNNELLVSVHMITYNHEKYIARAIEGVLIQETDFLFELIVSDDCSTDKTSEIIKYYAYQFPEIIKPVFRKQNIGAMENYLQTFKLCKGKYIALCEGDDYWIDPLKLQKQVDFMEKHPSYGLCYSKAKLYNQKDEKFSEIQVGDYRKNTKDLILRGNVIPTPSTLFRSNLWNNYYEDVIVNNASNWLMGDYPLWLYISTVSKIFFLNETTCVYRKLNESASHHTDIKKKIEFGNSAMDIAIYFSDLEKLNLKNRLISRTVNSIAYYYSNNEIDKAEMISFFSTLKSNSYNIRLIKVLVKYKIGRCFFRFMYSLYANKRQIINIKF